MAILYHGCTFARYNEPELLHALLDKLASNLADYACYQIESGARRPATGASRDRRRHRDSHHDRYSHSHCHRDCRRAAARRAAASALPHPPHPQPAPAPAPVARSLRHCRSLRRRRPSAVACTDAPVSLPQARR